MRTRFPNLDIRFTNCGWSGDRVTGGGGGDAKTRIEKDFKPSNPTVVTVFLGMNDGGYTPWSEEKDAAFATGYDKLIQLMLAAAPKARYTLIQSSAYDDFAHSDNHYNEVLTKMGLHVKELASKYKFDYADFNTPLADVLKQAFANDPQNAPSLVRDRIHPGEAGHLVLAAALLKAWNAPSLVSEVTIDGKTGTVSQALGAKVTKTGTLEWKETDSVIPMPFNFGDPAVRLVVQSSDVMQSLNDEMLTVTGLDSGTYSLSIDGNEVAKVSADDLSKGLSLARLPTPMMLQSVKVASMVFQKVRLAMFNWRQVRRDLSPVGSTDAASREMQKLEDELVVKTRKAAAPVQHTFSLTKSSELKPRAAVFCLLQIAIVGILVAEIRSGPILGVAILVSAVFLTLATGGKTPSESVKMETPDTGQFLGSLVAVGLTFGSLAIAFLIGGTAATHFRAPIFVKYLLFFPAFWLVCATTTLCGVIRLLLRQCPRSSYSLKVDWIGVGKKRRK